MEKTVSTLADFTAEAERFAATLRPRESGATLVTLSGDLGAGKTAFTQGIARAYGVLEPVTSPTFVLEKEYALADVPFARLVHIDAYRLEGPDSLVPLAFRELMLDPGALVLFEWPERADGQLPLPAQAISITAHDDGSRTIAYGS